MTYNWFSNYFDLVFCFVYVKFKVYHTVRKWIYIGHKLPRTFDSSHLWYKCIQKMLRKINLNKEKKSCSSRGNWTHVPHPLWPGLVWPESNEKCQACCQLSYRGTCIIMLRSKKNFFISHFWPISAHFLTRRPMPS